LWLDATKNQELKTRLTATFFATNKRKKPTVITNNDLPPPKKPAHAAQDPSFLLPPVGGCNCDKHI
jgi:hypothetical protein